MHGAAEGGSEGAFPVSGEEVQFAKMTEAEKGKEGRKEGRASRTELQSQAFGGEKALCQFCDRSGIGPHS